MLDGMLADEIYYCSAPGTVFEVGDAACISVVGCIDMVAGNG